jgi:hypothetical protein
MRFVNDFVSYSEIIVGRWCSERIDQQGADKRTPHPQEQTETHADDFRGKTVDENLFTIIDRDGFSESDRFLVVPEGVRVLRENEIW